MHHIDYCCNYYAVSVGLDPFRKTPSHHHYAHYYNNYHYYYFDDDDSFVAPNNSLHKELCNHKQFDKEPQVGETLDGGGTHHLHSSYVALVGSHIETGHSSDCLKKRKGNHGDGHLVKGPSGLCNPCCDCNPSCQLIGGAGYRDKVELHLMA